MRKIRNLNKEEKMKYERRLIWELFQNAKDSFAGTALEISLNISDESFIFSHTGKNFTCKDLLSIATQKSSKAFINDDKVTGKFGTGFITTHLLSEEVHISGTLENDDNLKKEFTFEIDRTGKDIFKIKESIEKEIKEIKELNFFIQSDEFSNLSNKTEFKYVIKEQNDDLARKSFIDIEKTISYIFSFLNSIQKVEVILNGKNNVFSISDDKEMDDYKLIKVNLVNKEIEVLITSVESIDIAIPISIETKEILLIDKETPRLFCDFPIIGSEKFRLPIVINSKFFDIPEPRDEIFDNEQNILLLDKVPNLYSKLIDYLVKGQYKKLFYLSPVAITNEVISSSLVRDMKKIYEAKPLIRCIDGKYHALIENNEPAIIFPYDDSEEIIEEFWKLSVKVNFIKKIPIWEDYFQWLEVVSKKYTMTTETLLKYLETVSSLEEIKLIDKTEESRIEWLNQLLNILSKKENFENVIISKAIIPNQKKNW